MSLRSRTGLRAFEQEQATAEALAEEQRLAPIKAAAQRAQLLEQQNLETEQQIVRDTIFTHPSEHLVKASTRYNRNLTVAQVTNEIGRAVAALKLHLDAQGKEITPDGLAKIGKVSELNRDIDATEPKNLITIFEYLEANGCFNSSDVKVTRVVQPVEDQAVEAQPTVAELQAQVESTPAHTREGQAKAKQLATLAMCLEAQPVYHEFVKFIASTYQYAMTAEDGDRCVEYMRANNLRLDIVLRT